MLDELLHLKLGLVFRTTLRSPDGEEGGELRLGAVGRYIGLLGRRLRLATGGHLVHSLRDILGTAR